MAEKAYQDLRREELIRLLAERETEEAGGIRITYKGQRPPWQIVRKVKPRRQKIDTMLCIGSEEDQSCNLIVEGENLSAMVALYKYRGQVDLILTDPPYNTGGDFRYNDRWDEDPNDPDLGRLVPADDGSKHSKWLRFMTPRLWMMKEMLKPGGILAICIDHRELFRLGMLLDQIFDGDQIGIINWQKAFSPKNDSTHLSTATEYVLVYAKGSVPVASARCWSCNQYLWAPRKREPVTPAEGVLQRCDRGNFWQRCRIACLHTRRWWRFHLRQRRRWDRCRTIYRLLCGRALDLDEDERRQYDGCGRRTRCRVFAQHCEIPRDGTSPKKCGTIAAEGKALTKLVQTLSWNRPGAVAPLHMRAMEINESIRNRVELVKVHAAFAVTLTCMGSFGIADDEIRSGLALTERCGYRGGLVWCWVAAAFNAIRRGDMPSYTDAVRRVVTVVEQVGGNQFWAEVARWWGDIDRDGDSSIQWIKSVNSVRQRWKVVARKDTRHVQ